MIDLTKKGLPDAIVLNGKSFLIKTDFREWIKFEQLSKKKDTAINEFFWLLNEKAPIELYIYENAQKEFAEQLWNFYLNKNTTPKLHISSSEVVSDLYHDGEYIYSANIVTGKQIGRAHV